MMVYRTRQRTKLAATREKELSPSQVKASEDNASDKDLAKESSSEESEGEVVEKEQSDEDEPIQWKQQQSDCELDALPDILNLESCDELIRADTMSSQQKRLSTEVGELCCSLDHRTNVARQLYFSFDVESVVRGHSSRAQPLCQGGHDPHHKLMKKSIITPDFEKRDSVPPISQSRYTMEKTKKVRWCTYSAALERDLVLKFSHMCRRGERNPLEESGLICQHHSLQMSSKMTLDY